MGTIGTIGTIGTMGTIRNHGNHGNHRNHRNHRNQRTGSNRNTKAFQIDTFFPRSKLTPFSRSKMTPLPSIIPPSPMLNSPQSSNHNLQQGIMTVCRTLGKSCQPSLPSQVIFPKITWRWLDMAGYHDLPANLYSTGDKYKSLAHVSRASSTHASHVHR